MRKQIPLVTLNRGDTLAATKLSASLMDLK